MLAYLTRLAKLAITITFGFGGGIALLFFIFMVVIRGQQDAAPGALKAGLILGIVFSWVVLSVMILLDLTAKLFIAKGLSNNFWDLEQRREIIVEGTTKQILHACRQALLIVPNATSISDDAVNLTAKALTGPSWRSPGEEITVEISPLNETQSKVRCISHSKSSKVIFDYGKNFENVETWRRQMDIELKSLAK